MEIGIISDTHSNFFAIKKACEIFRTRNINIVLHCGDITSKEALRGFKGFNLYFVFGNIDVNREELEETAKEFGFRCLREEGSVILNKKKIVMIHGDNKKRLLELIAQQEHDIIITGHTHKKSAHLEKKTLVINPGAHNPLNTQNEDRTVAILDLEKQLIPNNVLFFSIIDS